MGFGVVLLSFYLWGPKIPWGLLGLIFIANGISGFCPVWKILGISTLKKLPPVRKTEFIPIDDKEKTEENHESDCSTR